MHLEALEDELSGISSISASYRRLSMEVEYDETRVTLEQIICAVNSIGYHPEGYPARSETASAPDAGTELLPENSAAVREE